VGLVLSGGSAKGFAHIGVLQVLESVGLPIDVVAGTSMGAFIGGLFAIGYTPAMLEQVAVTQDWGSVFRNPVDRRQLTPEAKLADARYVITLPLRGRRVGLPAGLIGGQNLSELLSRLTWSVHGDTDFTRLSIPFAPVATDLGTGEAVVLRYGSLAAAMRASMALPSIFAPVAIGGRRLIDGGVARNLPARDARALGADVLVCVDVSDPLFPAESLRTALDVMLQTITIEMQRSLAEQRKLCDVIIDPDVAGLSSASFDQAAEWIARGVAAALAMRPRLVALADSVRRLRSADFLPTAEGRRAGLMPRPPAPLDSIYALSVHVRGPRGMAGRFVAPTVDLRVPGWITVRELGDAVTRLYGTGHFAQVTYSILPGEGGVAIVLDIVPRDEDVLGVGVRYESQHQTALLASVELHDQLVYGSTLRLDLRLGEPYQLDAQFLLGADGRSRTLRRLRATYLTVPLDLYESGRATVSERITTGSVAALIGRLLARGAVLGVELKGVIARHTPIVAPPESLAATQRYFSLSGVFWLDTYDRTALPTRGGAVLLQSEVADRRSGSGATFWRNFVDVQGLLPLRRRLSLSGRATVGWATGPDLPIQSRFYLGGPSPTAVLPTQFVPFLGLKPQERSGRRLVLAQIGLQQELSRSLIAQVRWNVGGTFEQWPTELNARDYASGVGLTLSALSPVGPLALTAAWGSPSKAPALSVDLGFRF
jgi:NTE family protein